MDAQLFDKLEKTQRRSNEIEALMATPEVSVDAGRLQRLAKERAAMAEMVDLFREYQGVLRALEDAQGMVVDQELGDLAREEMKRLEIRQEELGQAIRVALLPKDPNDEKDVIVEVRAGTGGEEAAMFVGDLFRMYSRYAEQRRWQVEVLNASRTGIGGFKELVFEVRGRRAFSRLKHERGVHRVQRIPVTESGGRVHTSTATVAVLPEANEVEVTLNPDDLRIDIFHAGGHGGQNVNKVATAVRVNHLPTGIVVVCQDERSQLRNKTKALAVLRARLLDREVQRQQAEVTAERRAQVGGAERAEKVRTYNFPQNRVTDHRINLTLHNLTQVMEGDLDGLLDALTADEQARSLEAALA